MKKMLKISNSLRIPLLAALLITFLSCYQKPKVKQVAAEPKKSPDTTITVNIDKQTDNLVSFISGVGDGRNNCSVKLDSLVKWKQYATELDTMFTNIIDVRAKKMKIWADSQFIRNDEVKTVFYPFAGPDFLNANIFYPGVDRYILVAMEPIGSLPDICNMIPDSVRSYLNTVNYSLRDIFKRSYFITKRMNEDLQKTKVNGTLPLISLFIKRTGHQIVSMQKIGIDSTGKLINLNSYKSSGDLVLGMKIDFYAPEDKKIQEVMYLRADISDKGLEKKPGFRKYLESIPQSYSYLKAASFLMHFDEFTAIRNLIFRKSYTILQDDSGIAYKYFDKERWDIKLYGKYSKPKKEFSYISEPDLEKAYQTSAYRPLTFHLGYNWASDNINLLYAVRKAK